MVRIDEMKTKVKEHIQTLEKLQASMRELLRTLDLTLDELWNLSETRLEEEE